MKLGVKSLDSTAVRFNDYLNGFQIFQRIKLILIQLQYKG